MNAFQTTVLAIGTTIACLVGTSIVLWWAYEAVRLLHREWRGWRDHTPIDYPEDDMGECQYWLEAQAKGEECGCREAWGGCEGPIVYRKERP